MQRGTGDTLSNPGSERPWVEYWQPTGIVTWWSIVRGVRQAIVHGAAESDMTEDWSTHVVPGIFGSVDAKHIYLRQIFPKVLLQRCHHMS